LAHNIPAYGPISKYSNNQDQPFHQLLARLETTYQRLWVWAKVKYFFTNTLMFWGTVASLVILFLLGTRTTVTALRYIISLRQQGRMFKVMHFVLTMLCTKTRDTNQWKVLDPDMETGIEIGITWFTTTTPRERG
jgi:acyl-coenzyme A synthetase/AMP-(fatty) acid ligase